MKNNDEIIDFLEDDDLEDLSGVKDEDILAELLSEDSTSEVIENIEDINNIGDSEEYNKETEHCNEESVEDADRQIEYEEDEEDEHDDEDNDYDDEDEETEYEDEETYIDRCDVVEDDYGLIEDVKKKRKKSLSRYFIAGIMATVVISSLIVNNRETIINKDKHIKLADEAPIISESSINKGHDDTSIVKPTKEFEITPMGDEEHIKTDLGELGDKPLIADIVTKVDLGQGDKRYAGKIIIGQGDTVFGYDKVKAYIEEFNRDSSEIIKIPNKPKKDTHTDLVLLRFGVKISDDFPVEDIYNKIVKLKPVFKMEIDGKLENDLYTFELPRFTAMYKYGDIKAGDTIQVGFIAFMPYNIKSDKYKLKLIISDKLNDENKLNIDIESFDTPKEK